jgi:hypothetical protein
MSHVDCKCHRNHVKKPPSLRNMLKLLLYLPSQGFLMTGLTLRSCGADPNVDLYSPSQVLIGCFYFQYAIPGT